MANIAALAYLVSGILFIMALRGLSHPTTSIQGNRFGIAGMAIAILTTLFFAAPPSVDGFLLIAVALGAGGVVGAVIARKVAMTQMPQLVAGFHSLVGLAAVFVAAAALYSPEAFDIGSVGAIKTASIIEMAIGTAIGAMTFTGSIIAFAKLNGNMSGSPILLPQRHLINIALAVGVVVMVVAMINTQSTELFWAITFAALAL
ncbi:MAG: NAD(P)(+) transhydrogenase (Re/Si-specific) subunit beta, partial [Pseudomonadota bacterium]